MDSVRPAGENCVWLTAMGLAAGIIMVIGIILLIFVKGVSVFWPKEIALVHLVEGSPAGLNGATTFAGAIVDKREKLARDPVSGLYEEEYSFFIGNKQVYQQMYYYVDVDEIASLEHPEDIMVAERTEYGNAIFYPKALTLANGTLVPADSERFKPLLQERLEVVEERRGAIAKIEKKAIGAINREMEAIRVEKLWLQSQYSQQADSRPEMRALDARKQQLDADYQKLEAAASQLRAQQQEERLTYQLVTGEERTQPLGEIVAVFEPNRMSFIEKISFFISHAWQFVSDSPREANTEGGIFPAIFGTFAMTLLMSVIVMPFGVVAAIYLREYAKQGPFVQMIRIAVNNLAGVPSIVYGVFGLGFFVYIVGGKIDALFYPEVVEAGKSVFGTGGILWAAFTLALMTIPVVVVATEEALAAVPRGMREASLACGASKWQTIQRVVMPASASGIITGLILAMARGAGEVAPLMLVGVIKLVPDLPIDAQAPFVHLDRKFMHMGFHIYDLALQSPNSEAAKPMVFATAFLLIMLVVVLNLGAILIRDRLRRKYASGTF